MGEFGERSNSMWHKYLSGRIEDILELRQVCNLSTEQGANGY
jgi:hypothetical protein